MMHKKLHHLCSALLACTAALLVTPCNGALATTRLSFALHAEPRTLDPSLVDDNAAETVRYLTQGSLVRLNRRTQLLEPELATSWSTGADGRSITFVLRTGVRFSDGQPFEAQDVIWSVQHVMDPALHAPLAESLRTAPGPVLARAAGARSVTLTFPGRVVDLAQLFSSLSILRRGVAGAGGPVLGPYVLTSYERGTSLLLQRNPHYWKRDTTGESLPYIDQVRLVIQSNRNLELAQYLRGELQLINDATPEQMRVLAARPGAGGVDLGPSLDSEQLWFNQAPAAPLPAYEREWFRSTAFRNAISLAIARQDLVRIAYEGHATPASGPISPANRLWFDTSLQPISFDPSAALRLLASAGFQLRAGRLYDASGHPVGFSILTNSGNLPRERMAALIQQDLQKIGVAVQIVTLDFPALIERIMHSSNYEACLLGLTNVEPDPETQSNLWLSSSANHQWSPSEPTPATPWEAEIDKLIQLEASDSRPAVRKRAIERLQQIVREQQPFIYLVNRNALAAISPALSDAQPGVLFPQTFWRVEWMQLKPR